MGSWVFTCGLTGLPIREDQEVVAMIIGESCNETTPSYPFSVWNPASLLIHAKYADYGDLEMSDDEWARLQLSHNQNQMYHAHDSGKDVGGNGMKTRRLIFKRDHLYDPCRGFALWMAHRQAYDQLSLLSDQIWNREKKVSETLSINDIVARKKLEALAIVEMAQGDEEKRREARWQLEDLGRGEAFYGIGFQIARGEISKGMGFLAEDTIDKERIEQGLEWWSDLYRLHYIMRMGRQTLYPSGSCGSQDLDYDFHAKKAEIILKFTKFLDKDFREFCGEGEEDEDENEA